MILDRPALVILCCLLMVGGFTGGLKDSYINPDFRLYFSEDNPQMLAFEALEADFNKQDNLTFLLLSDGGVFTEKALVLIRSLTDDAWKLPYARRVDSITNFPRTISENDELISDDLVGAEFVFNERSIEVVRKYALEDVVASRFISVDEKVAVITVSLNLPDDDLDATSKLVGEARKLVAEKYGAESGIDVKLIGTAIINMALQEAVERDLGFLIPVSYLVIFGVMYFLLRVVSGVFITIGVITLSNFVVLGAFVWSGGILTPGVSTVPNMVMIIAVADCMHLLVSYYQYLRQFEKREALERALSINLKPMFITSVTTAIGLLCLNFSESPPYRDLGNMVAFGAIVAFLLTITFVPACLMLLPVPKNIQVGGPPKSHEKVMLSLGGWVSDNSYKLAGVSLILVLALASQLPKNDLSDNWETYYDETFPVKQALLVQENQLYGSRFIDYKVLSGEEGGIYSPRYMSDLDSLAAWLRKQPKVGSVTAFSDQVKKIHQTLHENNPSYFSIPGNRELLSQSVLLYEMSLPFGMGTEEQVDLGKASTRLSVQLHSMESDEFIQFDKKVTEWVRQNTNHLHLSEGTGLDIVFANISQRNLESLILGTAIALVLISLILIFLLKSVRLGLISLVPNLVPAAMAYGVWGMWIGRVDLAVSGVATMSLGLVVDDTVHFLSKYQHAKNTLDKDVYESIRYAFQTVGSAMLITSVVLALGFGLLYGSHFSPTWSLGALLSLTVVFALVVDFLLLPGLLVLFDKSSSNEKSEEVTT